MAFALAVASLYAASQQARVRGAPAPRSQRPRASVGAGACSALLPRAAFPRGMTRWASERTGRNVGAVASGFQQAHYRWGYLIVTPDVYPTGAAARRRYATAVQLAHGDHRAPGPRIGQQIALWVTRDQLVGDTVTTVLLRSGRTVAMINVGARAPAIDVAARIAHAVDAHACR